MNHKLHIISLDIPLPANYGGVMDIYYKAKALAALGIDITLHCFQYGDRKPQKALNEICTKIYYYPRKTGIKSFSISLPFIVSSRNNAALLKNLLLDNEPILFEGIHTTFFATHPALADRIRILRAHNIEHLYYQHLYQVSSNPIKKIYYRAETQLLRKYEHHLPSFDAVLSISNSELSFFRYCTQQLHWIPAFHALNSITTLVGKGAYCLYHGNLSVEENEHAALYLCTEVFNALNIPLIIAGKNPSKKLLSHQSDLIQIIANPTEESMNNLITHAHIHVLPSFQPMGIKLKLLHALFAGRFCVINDTMLAGSGIDKSIYLANNTEAFKTFIQTLFVRSFSEDDIAERKVALANFNNQKNAQKIIDILNILH